MLTAVKSSAQLRHIYLKKDRKEKEKEKEEKEKEEGRQHGGGVV